MDGGLRATIYRPWSDVARDRSIPLWYMHMRRETLTKSKSKSKSHRQHDAGQQTTAVSTLPPLPSELPPMEEIGEEALLAATTSAPAAEPAPAVEVPAVVVGRRTRYSTDHFIVVQRANPKKMGSAGYDRYALYSTGMRVSEYLAHPSVGKYGRADIAWDLDRKFIEIVPDLVMEADPAPSEDAPAVTEDAPAATESDVIAA